MIYSLFYMFKNDVSNEAFKDLANMVRISVVIDFCGCAFGIGVTYAFFQSIGSLPSDNDLLHMAHSGGLIRQAKSLNT